MKLTQQQSDFFLEAVGQYAQENPIPEELDTDEKIMNSDYMAESFTFVCDKIASSGSPIIIDTARYLMFVGFASMLSALGSSASEIIESEIKDSGRVLQ